MPFLLIRQRNAKFQVETLNIKKQTSVNSVQSYLLSYPLWVVPYFGFLKDWEQSWYFKKAMLKFYYSNLYLVWIVQFNILLDKHRSTVSTKILSDLQGHPIKTLQSQSEFQSLWTETRDYNLHRGFFMFLVFCGFYTNPEVLIQSFGHTKFWQARFYNKIVNSRCALRYGKCRLLR